MLYCANVVLHCTNAVLLCANAMPYCANAVLGCANAVLCTMYLRITDPSLEQMSAEAFFVDHVLLLLLSAWRELPQQKAMLDCLPEYECCDIAAEAAVEQMEILSSALADVAMSKALEQEQ